MDGVTARGTSQRGKTEDAAGASKTSQSSPWVAQLSHNHRDGASWWPVCRAAHNTLSMQIIEHAHVCA